MPARQFLLLQVRDRDDPMRQQEVACFANALKVESSEIQTFDLLTETDIDTATSKATVILVGGSGNYSVAGDGPECEPQLAAIRKVCEQDKPVFGSCWGFQAIARALGGRVVTDMSRAEVGAIQLRLTESGRSDRVFRSLDSPFFGQAGHQDCVVEAPASAVILASSHKVPIQAYRIEGKPIYCTQFHPELTVDDLRARVIQYPQYIRDIANQSVEEFCQTLRPSPEATTLLTTFIKEYV
ncbi:MAG: aminotransferase [Planctomycetaceae bacterium]|nr:aminotransferase [Planctomycetaceae bacterium]